MPLINNSAAIHEHSTSVLLKLFGSWATFVFQKPFVGHKNS